MTECIPDWVIEQMLVRIAMPAGATIRGMRGALTEAEKHGWKLVPREPSETAKQAGDDAPIALHRVEGVSISHWSGIDDLAVIWRAMWDAAPSASDPGKKISTPPGNNDGC